MGVLVIDIPAIAFTFETTRNVHADAVLAHLRHQDAFVNLLGNAGHWVDDGTRAVTAQR